MRAWLLSLLISVALYAPLVAAQEAPAQPPAEDATPDAAQDAARASDDPDAVEAEAAKVPLDEIRRYVTVFNAIRQAYVDPVNDRELMASAVRGLLFDLDPHSAYLEKADAEQFDEQTRGSYDGVGVELQQLPDGTLRVIAPLDDSPAARAGLRSGDRIVAIDGKMLKTGQSDASAPLRGKAGTKVVVKVLREGVREPFDLTLMRDTIRATSVRSRMLEPGLGYLRISSFQASTAADFNKQLDALQKDAPLRGLLLDLRSNPGGLLIGAVQIADELLENGGIVSTRGRETIGDSRFDATPGDRLHGAPVVVLVDAGSASAAEVLAGALHDNKRARVVGSRTFGKGSVQTLLPLDNGDSIKLTTARYYTPSGHSIQARGIEPDVVLHPEGGQRRPAPVSEAVLPGHLAAETGAMEGDNAGEVLPGAKPIEAALVELKRMAGMTQAPKPASKP
ncbi:S41 family peptidase [Thermomonas sp. XSG]|uniref:S41 family peptidase n=1 Tax=Thermomonas sp. XSG TaxID=2771436 RepID=UPI0016806B4B|nr:S41 family peptidase [Thermomonas sp. XSG]QNU14736.1 S41 family peptidase [Thermomonas sp. XSG]